jgi:hypothetical protein
MPLRRHQAHPNRKKKVKAPRPINPSPCCGKEGKPIYKGETITEYQCPCGHVYK